MAWTKFRPIAYVTSLPATPVDGTEVYYQSTALGTGGGATPSMADNGIVWHFRYRSVSAGPKWEYIGGPPVTHAITTSQSTASGSNTDLATVGPTVTVPLKGEYLVAGRAAIANNTNGAFATVEIVNNGVAQGYIAYAKMAAASQELTGSTDLKTEVTAALNVIKMQYRTGAGGTATFYDRFMSVAPIRVNAA